jgi:ribosomal protein L14E/L6E/L27E
MQLPGRLVRLLDGRRAGRSAVGVDELDEVRLT